jgi:lysophospholipase L1-like esterase
MRNLIYVLLILLAGCTPVVNTPLPTSLSGETEMSALRYLALGDSYTIGESVAEGERWPNQLAQQLEAEGIHTELTIIARTGWTVDELWQGIQANPPEGIYDLVTLLIGVNDQYRGYPSDGYRDDFRFMIAKAIEYAGGNADKVIVLSIPDWGMTPFAAGRNTQSIAREIDQFNSINREEAEKAGAHYVDITPISRSVTADSALIAPDGLHPSGSMYSAWTDLVFPIAQDMLK